MSESQAERGRAKRVHEDDESVVAPEQTSEDQDEDFDSLLDEIDDVLEVNAEEFVRSFVQKGGQ